ncbi:MAG TPA: Fic family protein [Burkholderiaceae bacterium]|nr:Fic family protein [Burkholderiaceae bacterium]
MSAIAFGRCDVAALEHGLGRLRDGFPLSLRLIREVHGVLMGHARGRNKVPGEFRKSQVWIGGTRPGNAAFVPPPANELDDCLKLLERFLNDVPEPTPPLVKAALAHVQFETIHPFLDGNGRGGRLLIVLQLCADGLLRKPMLFLSLFFKLHRQTYYALLNEVRLSGDWERWLDFFAEAVFETATQASDAAGRIVTLMQEHRQRVESLGRAAGSAIAVYEAMQRQPIMTSQALVAATRLTAATVNKSLVNLEALGIVSELTGRMRGRVFSYGRYIAILNEGME